ncbi:MAG: exostosin family-domain-containing protein [Monoraphidium minutum]|nr:MAG: exostosin family-domain-containing protein [Monoraphidium minutum]
MERQRRSIPLLRAVALLAACALAGALVLLAGCSRTAGAPSPGSRARGACRAGEADKAAPGLRHSSVPEVTPGGPSSLRRACPPGCSSRGNCNHDDGRCECPWGFAGPACEDNLLAACALAPNASAVQCGDKLPRPCACLRQCYEFFCPRGGPCVTPRDMWVARCFEVLRPGAGAAGPAAYEEGGITSDIPEEQGAAAARVAWFLGARADQQRRRITRHQALDLGNSTMALPLGRCPSSCNFRGQCVGRGGRVRCACWHGYEGAGCEATQQAACVNGCSGRGACIGGFCHCSAGFWGRDCARSRAFPPRATPPPPPPGLRLFTYELPSHIAFDFQAGAAFSFDAGFAGHHPNYAAYTAFDALLARDGAVRTEDPWEASLFLVPAAAYAYASNTGDAAPHLRRVMAYVRDTHPFFNRSGGRDHVLWLPGDRGACWLPRDDPLLGPPIKVTHWGLAAVPVAIGAAPPGGDDLARLQAPCHRPHRDVVAAPYAHRQAEMAAATYGAGAAAAAPPRSTLLFFAGNPGTEEVAYSGGVRQDMFRLFSNATGTGVTLVAGGMAPGAYEAAMRGARFCLAPYGYGWGIRLSEAVALGCVPVIVQDGVLQPHEDDGLPYHDFSLRLPRAALPALQATLAALPAERYTALAAGLARHWAAFVWDPSAGGAAYDAAIAALARRAVALAGGQF